MTPRSSVNRRLAPIILLVGMLPLQWTERVGCDEQHTLETVTGFEVLTASSDPWMSPAIVFGLLFWGAIAAIIANRVRHRVLAILVDISAALGSAYAAFFLHFVATFTLFHEQTTRWPAYVGVVACVGSAVDALTAAVARIVGINKKAPGEGALSDADRRE